MTDDPSAGELAHYAFQMRPQFEESAGSWTVRHPGSDWWVSGRTKDEATQRFMEEFLERQNNGEDPLANSEATYRRHLDKPVPGVFAMDNELYVTLREHGAAQADFERAFTEAEEHRLRGEPYTKADFYRNSS